VNLPPTESYSLGSEFVARGSLERAIEISRRGKRATVNFEDIVTLTNFDARRTQRRLKLGIPVLAGEDPADS